MGWLSDYRKKRQERHHIAKRLRQRHLRRSTTSHPRLNAQPNSARNRTRISGPVEVGHGLAIRLPKKTTGAPPQTRRGSGRGSEVAA